MVFVDYQNFFISWKWKNKGRKPPTIDYKKLGRAINRRIPLDSEVVKNLAAHSRDFSRELAASLNSLF